MNDRIALQLALFSGETDGLFGSEGSREGGDGFEEIHDGDWRMDGDSRQGVAGELQNDITLPV
jgi:hypothetical protein